MARLTPRTYALTAVTHQRHRLFQRTESAELLSATILRYREQGKFLLHGFVVIPDHLHALITPADSIERSAQLIKGGFSFALRKIFPGEVWQDGYHEHRIRDAEDFNSPLLYIANNPNRLDFVDYLHVHTRHSNQLDPIPSHFLA